MSACNKAFWKTLLAAFVGFVLISPVVARDQALKTPPAALSGMSAADLNAFGLKAANEAYAIMARVGSPTGQIGGKLNQVDKNAVVNAKKLIADKALIQNASFNHGMTKKTYTPSDIDDYKISDLVLTHPVEDVLVASYKVALPQRVDLKTGAVMSGAVLPRLTVMQWNAKVQQWQIFSHADFDTPSATLCGYKPGQKVPKAVFSKADNALGAKVMTDFVDAMLKGTLKDHVIKGFQYVYASGEKKTDDGPVRTTIEKQTKRLNLEAVRSGRLLAVRYDTQSALKMDGDAIDPSIKPRLFTFYQTDHGDWRFLASAVFSVTAKAAAGVSCVKPTVR